MSTKKSISKKTETKTPLKKQKSALTQASDEQCFWLVDGRTLRNLIELNDAFVSMTDDVFAHHVTDEKNDFSDWIRDVLQDATLSTSLRKCKKPLGASKAIRSRLRIYIV